jgi:hypothetical protein
MFCELDDRLYRSRDVFSSALVEYDDTCMRHDAEMDGVRAALLAKFGKVPVLETYRQMAIRRQKVKDWQQAIWWVERGLPSSRGEFHPPALTDPYVNLSVHTALVVLVTRLWGRSCSRPSARSTVVVL